MAENKNYIVRNKPGTSHYHVMFEGGGEIPADLSGIYTSVKEARLAIDQYNIKKNRQDVKIIS